MPGRCTHLMAIVLLSALVAAISAALAGQGADRVKSMSQQADT